MIDLLDPALHASGRALDAMRALPPIAWCAGRRGPGYWAVTGYAELVAIARDPEVFTSWWGTRPEVARPDAGERALHNLDPPAHTELRRIAMTLVAPARLDALAPIVRGVATAVVDAFVPTGGDAVARVALPIASQVFAAWLGLGIAVAPRLAAQVEAVHAAGAALLDGPDDHTRTTARAASAELADWLRAELVAGAPAHTVLGDLRGLLPEDRAISLAVLLVEAGLPTLADAIAAALVTDTAPLEPRAATDEILRLASPIMQFARYATRDVTIGSATIRAGQQVVLWYAAANRDPRTFADPDQISAARAPHVAFGAGPHRCLGATFARRVLEVVREVWQARVATCTARGARRASSYMSGYTTLQLAVTPRSNAEPG